MLTAEAAIPELTEEKISASPHGCSASFMKINNDWGVKIFNHEYVRDDSHREQAKAAEFGLAPRVGDKFNFGNKYCMVCEVAEPFYDTSKEGFNWTHFLDLQEKTADMREEFSRELMEATGFCFTDNHVCNIGKLRGRIVCIDFSE